MLNKLIFHAVKAFTTNIFFAHTNVCVPGGSVPSAKGQSGNVKQKVSSLKNRKQMGSEDKDVLKKRDTLMLLQNSAIFIVSSCSWWNNFLKDQLAEIKTQALKRFATKACTRGGLNVKMPFWWNTSHLVPVCFFEVRKFLVTDKNIVTASKQHPQSQSTE